MAAKTTGTLSIADTSGNVRRVTLVRASTLEVPQLYMSVFIAANQYERKQFAEWLGPTGCYLANNPEEADLIIFGGGEDVCPDLYKAVTHHPMTRYNKQRDQDDIELFDFAVKRGIAMLGICRGAQFLHVMNGGKLYQHVDNHNTAHHCYSLRDSTLINNCSSVHHQMCIEDPSLGMEVILTASKSKSRWRDSLNSDSGNVNRDVEAFWYRDTACLGIQGHPEYRDYPHFSAWCSKQIEHYFLNNPDFTWVKKVDTSGDGVITSTTLYRMNSDLVGQRREGWAKRVKDRNIPLLNIETKVK